jgi:hypothetical protein
MRSRLLAIQLIAVVVCSLTVIAQAPTGANPIIGTWKLSVDKSTYSPGPPPLKGSTSVRQYAAGDDGSIVAITMNINPQGLPALGAISAAKYDGKEYPQHTLATLATSLSSHIGPRITRTISYKQINPFTVEIVQRQDGMVLSTSTRTVSRDGMTMTERTESTNPTGEKVLNVLIFEKQ